MTPKCLGVKPCTYLAPFGGWLEKQYYLVEVAYTENNTIHRCIFYSGFLTNGVPSSYNCILSPTVEGKPTMNDLYCLKPIKRLRLPMEIDL